MTHKLPALPYAQDALQPHISAETLSFHHGKHHATYVDKLNAAIVDTEYADKSLEDIILSSDGGIFNNAAQIWNHSFYWRCLSPDGGGEPENPIAEIIERDFGSLDDFKKQFSDSAATLFGSGWTWLVLQKDGKLAIMNTSNADTPVRQGITPLLTCDVWEHAYYLDYQNSRPNYLKAFWELVDWEFVNKLYSVAEKNEQSAA